MKCYSCGKPITEANSSEEHIINNSIGGRIRSRILLCINCNSDFGNTIDSELEEQIGMFTDLLGIKRERSNKVPKIKMTAADGEVKYVGAKLKPHSRLKFDIPGKEVTLFTNDENYDKLKNRKQRELDMKFKTTFVEYSELPTKKVYYVSNKLSENIGHIAFGSYDYFRSIAKMCLNYYLYKGYDIKYCGAVVDFVKGIKQENIVHYFYPTNQQIHDLGDEEVSHIIQVCGNKQSRVLYGYIELFNMQNAIVIFDMEYDGQDFEDTFCYDLLNNTEVTNKEVKIRLTRNHFEDLDLIARSAVKEHTNKYNRVLRIIEKNQLHQS